MVYITFVSDVPDINGVITAIDIETTGLHPFNAEIIEVGAVRFTIHGEILGEYTQLIKPYKRISPAATAINGIDDEMVKDSPSCEEILPALYEFISDSLIIAHNAPFDLSFLQFYGMVAGKPFPETHCADTLIMSREVFKYFSRHSLHELVTMLNIKTDSLHRALPDAKACGEIFLKGFQLYSSLHGDWNTFYEHYGFHTSDWQNGASVSEELHPIIDACREGRNILIEYIDSHGIKTTRIVTPYQIVKIRQVPYIIGHCHLRDATRNFRLDRIDHMEVL